MRILVASTWMPYPPDNGSRQRAYHLLTHLSRRHSLTVLTFGTPRDLEDAAPLRALCERVDVVPPGEVSADRLALKGLLSPAPRYYVQSSSPRMAALIGAAADDHDVVLGLQIDVALALLSAVKRTPSVLDEIEVGAVRDRFVLERSVLPRLRHGLTWWKFQGFVRFLVSRFDRTTVVSHVEREFLRAIGCDTGRVVVVPNGVDIPVTPPVGAGARARRLVYPGPVTYSANLDAVRFFIREVFPLIRRAHPDLEFTVTGSTAGVDLAELASAAGVVFTGRLPDVDRLIAESAACVVPLRIGGGTRLKVLKSMALGTPVLSTSKGIEGLEAEPGRHVLVADSAEGLAAHVARILGDPDFGGRVAAAAREFVRQRYDWEACANALEHAILRAVDDHRQRR